jgi:hypothetical protein
LGFAEAARDLAKNIVSISRAFQRAAAAKAGVELQAMELDNNTPKRVAPADSKIASR